MAEQFTEYPQRLEFKTLQIGDELVITTGQAEAAWRYDFSVETAGHWPEGMLTATTPAGEETPPTGFALHGCGRWTTRIQNPVQTQEHGFTPYYDGLIVGSLLWAKHLKTNERLIFGRQKNESAFSRHPGDEISVIAHTPYRQNQILQALQEQGTSSATMVHKSLANAPIEISPKDVRSTLLDMVQRGQLSLLRKKVMLFEIAEQD